METYTTHLSIDECRHMLRQRRSRFLGTSVLQVNGMDVLFVIYTYGNRFWLRVWDLSPLGRNSFRPIFWGRLAPTDNGTSITGRFHMGWFFAIPVAGFLVYLSQPSWSLGETIVFCTVFASVCGLAYFFNRIAAREEKLVRYFIRETLEAS